MSREEASGGQQDVNKELEAKLKHYEKELQDAKEKLKQKDEEIRLKDECASKNRKELEERDRFIKHLKDKMNKGTEIKQMKPAFTEKDSLISKLYKRIQLLEQELKEQIKESEEKLEEELKKCKEEMEQVNRKTRDDMEERLHLVQLGNRSSTTTTEVVVLQKMVDMAMNRFSTLEQNLQNVSNTVSGLREDTTDLKFGMRQQAEAIQGKLHDTQRQMSEELSQMKKGVEERMNETAQRMTEKIEEQGAAIREEFQSKKQELKDEMTAKMDEQAAEVTQKMDELQTDFQEAITAITPAQEPIEEITYSVFEVDETPHEASQCVLSSSSANSRIDAILTQVTQGNDDDAEFVHNKK